MPAGVTTWVGSASGHPDAGSMHSDWRLAQRCEVHPRPVGRRGPSRSPMWWPRHCRCTWPSSRRSKTVHDPVRDAVPARLLRDPDLQGGRREGRPAYGDNFTRPAAPLRIGPAGAGRVRGRSGRAPRASQRRSGAVDLRTPDAGLGGPDPSSGRQCLGGVCPTRAPRGWRGPLNCGGGGVSDVEAELHHPDVQRDVRSCR